MRPSTACAGRVGVAGHASGYFSARSSSVKGSRRGAPDIIGKRPAPQAVSANLLIPAARYGSCRHAAGFLQLRIQLWTVSSVGAKKSCRAPLPDLVNAPTISRFLVCQALGFQSRGRLGPAHVASAAFFRNRANRKSARRFQRVSSNRRQSFTTTAYALSFRAS